MIEQTVGKFKRRVYFKPGFDWRTDNPSRSYGIHNMEMTFVLIGSNGAVCWTIGTKWFPKTAREHLANFPSDLEYKPTGYTLEYHSYVPMYEDQPQSHDCGLLDGGKCYSDKSYTNSELLIEGFLNGGDEWVWNRLEAYYETTFNGKPWPNFDPIVMPHPDDRPPNS